jgi:hypothetical protein
MECDARGWDVLPLDAKQLTQPFPACARLAARGALDRETYCKILIICRLSALDLVARNIWIPRRNLAV